MRYSRRHWLQHLLAGGSCWAVAAATESSHGATNPALEGNFAPVREEVELGRLKVIGVLPKDLRGCYLRNGPNPQFRPAEYHWFDGDGMVHRIRLSDGEVHYRNRFVRTAGFLEERAAGQALYGSLREAPAWRRLLSGKEPYKNTANTSLLWHADRCLALWEGGPPYQIDPVTLATHGPFTFQEQWTGAFTAHPKRDPVTGELFCFSYSPLHSRLDYGVFRGDGQLTHRTQIPMSRAVMMHDFAITENFALFMDLPQIFDVKRALRGLPAVQFEPAAGARIGVLPRRSPGSEMQWFDIGVCFVFHTLNAHEEGDVVVLRACRFPEFPPEMAFVPGAPPPRDAKPPVLFEWRLNRRTGAVRETPLDDHPAELPRLNEQRLGRPARFGYLGRGGGEMFDGLIKYDLQTGRAQHHIHGPGRTGNEGVFVPRPQAAAEDDGWVLTFVHDSGTKRGELVVLHAQDFEAPPQARVQLPVRVPYGFHGLWIPDEELG